MALTDSERITKVKRTAELYGGNAASAHHHFLMKDREPGPWPDDSVDGVPEYGIAVDTPDSTEPGPPPPE